MKKLFYVLALTTLAFSTPIEMPPSLPSIDMQTPTNGTKTVKADNCSMVPTMLYMLPPLLQNQVDNCQNEKNQPAIPKVIEYLSKNKIEYSSIKIKPVEDFVGLYQIDLGNEKVIYCNKTLSKCFKIELLN